MRLSSAAGHFFWRCWSLFDIGSNPIWIAYGYAAAFPTEHFLQIFIAIPDVNTSFSRMAHSAKQISLGGIIAALYFVITITPGISAVSFGQFQIRIAEALTVLPYLYPGAVWGLFVGCLLANVFGPFGIQDVIFAVGVSAYLHVFFGEPYWVFVATIGVGELIACFGLGYPLLSLLLNREKSFT
jgi:uncharacterized membrane protein